MALSTQTTVAEQTSSASDPKNEQSGQQRRGKFSEQTIISPEDDFVLAQEPPKKRLIISIEGEEKTGKDHFAFTAPGPIYLQTCDPEGSDGVRQKFPNKVYMPKTHGYQMTLDPNKVAADKVKEEARPLFTKFVANYRAALTKFRTIVWDTADEFWELCRLSEFGELQPRLNQGERNNRYAELNGMYEGLVKEAFAVPVNLIMIHRLKDEYVNNTRSGRRVRAGYKDMYYLTQVNLRSVKIPRARTDGQPGFAGADFGVTVLDCRRNPGVEGLLIQNDFATLANFIMPDIPVEEWR